MWWETSNCVLVYLCKDGLLENTAKHTTAKFSEMQHSSKNSLLKRKLSAARPLEHVEENMASEETPKAAEDQSEKFRLQRSSPRFGLSEEDIDADGEGSADGNDFFGDPEISRTNQSEDPKRKDTDLMQGLSTAFQALRLGDTLTVKQPPSLPLTPLPKHKIIVLSSSSDENRNPDQKKHEGTLGVDSSSEDGPISTIRKRLQKQQVSPSNTSMAASSSIGEESGAVLESGVIDSERSSASPKEAKPAERRPKSAVDRRTGRPAVKKLRPCERQKFASSWYSIYNEIVFDQRLPKNALIQWNPRLRKTAGQAIFMRFNKECSNHDTEEEQLALEMQGLQLTPRSMNSRYELKRIELSTKILNTEDKLATTLLHECCHVAQRLLETTDEPPHGPAFKRWAAKASRHFPQYQVTTRHDFALHQPYQWICASCQLIYRRHSKSIDPSKHRCGAAGCSGHLTYLGAFNMDGTARPSQTRPLSSYQQFIKDHYTAAYTQEGSHSSAMLWLSHKWKEQKSIARVATD
eukprot:Gregarina_sp_Poly_1__11210@NODE_91_length_14868_cov_482_446186_g78_i0_p4_GENE_NODE_91_length_14868_cov_482_446186_g78_i0NODE_91_length_14868_cov_482_446186_g78_i0_p4_ORF_typecomplete_len521_score77_90SprTlike/PF10263_9/2_9e22Zn_ribbon_SprT/PF17283_2/1_2e08DUF45/PF01863_17/0_00097DUF4653/PF15546_6/18DUF4653/PF15546_6/8_4_NODE_91_length_14868_cov_482_446186_g78_i047796341